MKIINIFEKKEYFMLLKFFITNIFSFFLYSDYVPYEPFIIIYKASLTIFSLYNIYCIFIESSFENNSLRLLQIKLNKYNFYLFSLFTLLSIAFTMLLNSLFISLYMYYKMECPFLLKNFDYKIHAQRRCELYNINSTNITNITKNEYICSFNAETCPFLFIQNLDSRPKCSKVEKLIENNEVIEEFIKEYYQESNLYYCKYKPASINWKIEPKICDAKIKIKFPVIFILLICYFGVRCIIQIYNYFRLIRPNIDHYEYLHID